MLVEVLLLRWAMLDRTVELSEVIDALKEGKGTWEEGRVMRPHPPPHRRRSRSPPPRRRLSRRRLSRRRLSRRPAPNSSPRSETSAPFGRRSLPTRAPAARCLGSLLAEADVVGVEGRVVILRPGHAIHAEGLERQRDVIARASGVT